MFQGLVIEVSIFFFQPAAGLTNQVPVRDSRAGAPLPWTLIQFVNYFFFGALFTNLGIRNSR